MSNVICGQSCMMRTNNHDYCWHFLQGGIFIVDSPGIGESREMNDLVKSYLPSAFAFIYVINSSNAGGLQPDRVSEGVYN